MQEKSQSAGKGGEITVLEKKGHWVHSVLEKKDRKVKWGGGGVISLNYLPPFGLKSQIEFVVALLKKVKKYVNQDESLEKM